MKPETDVRRGGKKLISNANLVVHDGVANVFDHASEFVCVLDVVEEILDVPLLLQRGQNLKNVFQFPASPRTSGSALYIGDHGITVPGHLSSISP